MALLLSACLHALFISEAACFAVSLFWNCLDNIQSFGTLPRCNRPFFSSGRVLFSRITWSARLLNWTLHCGANFVIYSFSRATSQQVRMKSSASSYNVLLPFKISFQEISLIKSLLATRSLSTAILSTYSCFNIKPR